MSEMRHAPPRRILLATDLSGRCDRALDRAALLAAEWIAKLVVVHALEWTYEDAAEAERVVPSWRRDATRRAAIAERQIREDLVGHEVPFETIIEEGEPTEIILKAAAHCDLIVTGTARSETFGRMMLGATVDRITRRAPVPVLVVKTRARQPYRRLVVATDFSDGAREALECAAALFPRSATALLHGYRPVADRTTRNRKGSDPAYQLAADACARFVEGSALSAESRARLEVFLESGHIESLFKIYADDKAPDLLVVGSHGRSAAFNLLLGSTAEKLLASAPCDVLVVRRTASMPDETRPRDVARAE